MFTSSLPKEGKSTCSVNTAIVLAQSNHRVLLVDADIRRPSVHAKMNLPNNKGLHDALRGADYEKQLVKMEEVSGLDILTAGEPSPNPTEMLASPRMRELLAAWRQKYDYIIVDTPPVLGMADSGILSSMLDAVILVVRSSQTHRTSLRRSRDLLEKISAPLIGTLVNGVDINSESHYDYYGYYGKSYNHYYLKGSK
jgi:capsular exopolysaccharide synthesis family protein